jgi:hypothetical protein
LLVGGCAPFGVLLFLGVAFSFSPGNGSVLEYLVGFCQILVGINSVAALALLGTSRIAPWRIALIALQMPLLLVFAQNLAEFVHSRVYYSAWAIGWEWHDLAVDVLQVAWLSSGILLFPLLAGQLWRFGLVGRRADYRPTIGQLLIVTAILAGGLAITQQLTQSYPQIALGNGEIVTISISLWEMVVPGLVASILGLVALVALLIVYRLHPLVSLVVLSAIVLSVMAAVLGTMAASGVSGVWDAWLLVGFATGGLWIWGLIMVQLWVYRRAGWELRRQRRVRVTTPSRSQAAEVADPLGPI